VKNQCLGTPEHSKRGKRLRGACMQHWGERSMQHRASRVATPNLNEVKQRRSRAGENPDPG
jgi:hypothetical protein